MLRCAVLCLADLKAADYFMQFQYGWIADPLYFGDYPKIMRDSQVRKAIPHPSQAVCGMQGVHSPAAR
jgi:hypothetical protein